MMSSMCTTQVARFYSCLIGMKPPGVEHPTQTSYTEGPVATNVTAERSITSHPFGVNLGETRTGTYDTDLHRHR